MPNAPDPKDRVAITQVDKRGEHYTVRGYDTRAGRTAEFSVPAPTIERMSRADAEAFMRRSIHGLANQRDRSERSDRGARDRD